MKTKILMILLFITLASTNTYANEFINKNIDGYNIDYIKVEQNKGYKVIVGVSQMGESLKSLVKRYNGVSGVNGAYFCPKDYKECNGINFSNAYRISEGKLYSKWGETGPENVVFGFDKNNNSFLFQNAHDYSTGRGDLYIEGKTINLDKKNDLYNGIGNFPALLVNGEDKLSESNAIDNKMKTVALKNFICSTKNGTTMMGGVNSIDIFSLPEILKKLGCDNAINLDSGGSSSMIYNNTYKKGPGRDIMDAFIVVKDGDNNRINNKTELENNIIDDENLKKYIEKSYKKIGMKINKLDIKKQKLMLKNIDNKLKILTENKKYSKRQIDILKYLKYLNDKKMKKIIKL